MNRVVALALVGLTLSCGRSAPSSAKHRAEPGDVAIVGGTVVPMDEERTLPGHTVLVRGDRIVAVAPAREVDVRAARVIDAGGRWVLPGLADMHVHFWSQEDLALFLLNGVTTIRNLAGAPEHVRWRDAIARGELDGPTLLTAGPIIDGAPPTWPGSTIVATADEARAAVRAQKDAGYDWLKVYNGVPAEAYDALLEEAKRMGLPVAGHVPRAVGAEKVIASGQRTIEHLEGYVPFFADPPGGDLVAATAASGVWNCPTLVVTDRFGKLDDPAQLAGTRGLELVSPLVRAQWDPKQDFRFARFTPAMFEDVRAKNVTRRALVRDLQAAGAELVLGTDAGNPYVVPGFAVVDELRLLVDAGLTPWQALRTATAAAGELQGAPGALGVIAAGARADLIVVDKDPLAAVAHAADPAFVVVRGEVHERSALLAAAKRAPPSPAALLAAMPPLPVEGAEVLRATYDVELAGQTIGAERIVVSRDAVGALVVNGQARFVAPSSSALTYRAARDTLELTADELDPPRVNVSRRGDKAIAEQAGKPPVELAAAADAVLAPQAIAEFIWHADALADLGLGKVRTRTAVEVMSEGSLVLEPGTFTFTRAPDDGGRRVYTVTGKIGRLDLKGHMSVDADGAPHEVSLTLVFGTFVIRRSGGDNGP